MNSLFIALDFDNAGAKIGQAVLMDDAAQLKEVSDKINAGLEAVKSWVYQNNGKIISSGGDELNAVFPDSSAEATLEQARQEWIQAAGFTMTVGVGNTLSQAGKALIAGKLNGKDMSVRYDEEVEEFLKQIHEERPDEAEAEKMNEHYLDHVYGGEDDDVTGEGHQDIENQPQEDYSDEEFEEEMPESMEGFGEEDQIPDQDQEGQEEIADEDMMPEEGMESDPMSDDVHSAIQAPEAEDEDAMLEDPESEEEIEDGVYDEDELSPEFDSNENEEPIDLPVNPVAEEQVGEDTDEANKDEMVDPEAPAEEIPQEQGSVPQETGDLDQLGEMLDGSGSVDEIFQRIAQNLEQFKQNKDLLEQIKQSNPELYQTIIGLFQNLIELAKETAGEPVEDQAVEPQAVDQQGAELPKLSG